MPYWLVKSEPNAFSWAQQAERGVEPWTGVRTHLARRHLAAMRLGDRALFYHSNVGREVVGVVEVVREAYPDPTAGAGGEGAAKGVGWVAVDVRAVAALPAPVPLARIKAEPDLAGLELLRQSRLSVSPVSEADWRRILALGGLPDGLPGSLSGGSPGDPPGGAA